MMRRRKIHPEDRQPVEGEKWDQDHQGYSYNVRRYWSVPGEPRHDFYDYNYFSKPALIQICRDVGVAANAGENVGRLIGKIRRQYNRKEVLAALRAELARWGLKTEGDDGLELRKRLDTYGNIGFGGLREDTAVRKELNKRHIAHENVQGYCQLLLLLIRYEFETNKEYCHWPWNLVHDSDRPANAQSGQQTEDEEAAARLRARQRIIIEEESRLRESPWLSGFRGHENEVFLQTDVLGDGSCLFRAFAHVYYGDEDRWETVRTAARLVWDAAMATNNSVARYRAQLYRELDQQSQDPRPSPQRARLRDQLFRDGHWGSVEMLQLLADAYGVEIFAHVPIVDAGTRQVTWDLVVRGNHTRDTPQIHLVNYPNVGGGHWTAVRPDELNRYTAHLELDLPDQFHVHSVPLARLYTGRLPRGIIANYDATHTPSPLQQGNPSAAPAQQEPGDPELEPSDIEIDMNSESSSSLSFQYTPSSPQFTPSPPSSASTDSSHDSPTTPQWNHTPSPDTLSSDAFVAQEHSLSGTANGRHSHAHILQQPPAPPTTPAAVIRPPLGSPFTTPPSHAPFTSRLRFSRIRQSRSNTPSPRSRRSRTPFLEHVTATGRTVSLSVRSPPSNQSSPTSAAALRRETRRNTAPTAPKPAGVRKAGRRDAKVWSGSGKKGHSRNGSGESRGSGSMSISSGSSRMTTASRGAGVRS